MYEFNLVLCYFDSIFCNGDFICEERNVISFLNLYPTYEMLDICTKRYQNIQPSFKTPFKIWLIDRLLINVKNDVRYVYEDSTEEQDRKKQQEKMEENSRKLKKRLKTLSWPEEVIDNQR